MSILPLDSPEHWKKFNNFWIKVILAKSDESMKTNVPPLLKVNYSEMLEAISPGEFSAFDVCYTPQIFLLCSQ